MNPCSPNGSRRIGLGAGARRSLGMVARWHALALALMGSTACRYEDMVARALLTRACALQPPNSEGGTEISSDGGQTWGPCQAFTCLDHYQLTGGSCAPRSYTLTITAPGHGAISGAMSGVSYPYGSIVNLDAVLPDATYGVRGWTGAAAPCGAAALCPVTMDGDKAVSVEIGKVPVGFGRGVTGGQGGAVVTATTAAELATALCDSIVSGACADAAPRIIRLASVIDFRGTEGTATRQGCVYAANDCTLNGRTEQVLDQGTFCSGKALSSITYDAAGTNPMLVGSNKTVIGVGASAGWKGKGLLLKGGVSNVVIRNLSITDINEGIIWAGDGIAMDGVSGVWIDHNTLARIGRMMIVSGWGTAANVTISNNTFDGATFCGHYCDGRHYWNVLLAGADQSITFIGNRLHSVSGDAPELGKPPSAESGGAVHLVNNYYDALYRKAIVPGSGVLALVEGNYFSDAPDFTPIWQPSGIPIFAPLDEAIATANAECRAALGRDCSGNRASSGAAGFILDAAVMPAIQATPAYAAGMAAVAPLSSAQVPASVEAAAGPQVDPDG